MYKCIGKKSHSRTIGFLTPCCDDDDDDDYDDNDDDDVMIPVQML